MPDPIRNRVATARAGALLTIDLDAICANWLFLRQRLDGRAACAAVVKADAYGLGAARVAPSLAAAGCRHFFVAHLDEGIALRRELPSDTCVYVLHGVPPGTEADCVEHRLIPVLNSVQQVDAYVGLAARVGRTLPAILQFDTGMARLGLDADEALALANNPARLAGLRLRYLMSHLACAEDQRNPANRDARDRFEALRSLFPNVPASFANSSAIFLGSDFHYDLARPGAALYGVAPVAGQANPMQPVIRLQGKVIQTRRVAAGGGVGYSHTWRAEQPTRIATVAVGYADGFLRSQSNRAVAWFGDVALPQVGNISMDTLTVDIGALPEDALHAGSLVDLIDPRHPVDDVAARAGTIGYEILTSLGGRYARDYVGATPLLRRLNRIPDHLALAFDKTKDLEGAAA